MKSLASADFEVRRPNKWAGGVPFLFPPERTSGASALVPPGLLQTLRFYIRRGREGLFQNSKRPPGTLFIKQIRQFLRRGPGRQVAP